MITIIAWNQQEFNNGRVHRDEPLDKVLQDRAIAILSAMLLYMKHNSMEKMEYKKVIPVKLGREEAERTGNYAEKWEIRVVVRKRGDAKI